MSRLAITKSKPTVVVGLDFGTTYSGFAYALVSEPERVLKFYEWPGLAAAGGRNYCKTPTSLFYKCVSGKRRADSYVLEDWGYAALVKHANNLQSKQQPGTSEHDSRQRASSSFVTLFKLLLAGKEALPKMDNASRNLPNGVTLRMAISDYLRNISQLVLSVLQNNLGNHIAMEDIQWCLTVPAIWDEPAKQEMKTCAEIAGLIKGQLHYLDEDASPHPLIIVLEPEAASVYCQEKAKFCLSNGNKFLVVDVGGGTVDLVLHEKIGDMEVREVSPSSGGLCGGTYVDQRFLKFLSGKIKCFENYCLDEPQSLLKMKGLWETIKHGFDGNDCYTYELELPAKLARAWETDEKYLCTANSGFSFDVIDLTLEDMISIFDPVVNEILNLIERKMFEGLKAIMVVGGFSASPYLMKRIKQTFSHRVEAIVFPKEPGSAICCGAVTYGVSGANLIVSRISKKTYGISLCRRFASDDPPHLKMEGPNGIPHCDNIFDIYVRNGQDIAIDECVSHTRYQTFKDVTESALCLYATSDSNPIYGDDSGVEELGRYTIKHPSKLELGIPPKFRISLYFGRTTVEVRAVGLNFGKGESYSMVPVTFERSSSYA